MVILAINTTLIEVIVLNLGAIILGVTIYFFLQSRKTLLRTIESHNTVNLSSKYTPESETITVSKNGTLNGAAKRNAKSIDILQLKEHLNELRQNRFTEKTEEIVYPKKEYHQKEYHQKEDLTVSLKQTIAQQQKILDGFLTQVEEIEQGGKDELFQKNDELQSDIERLEKAIERRDEEIEEYKKRTAVAEKMAARVDDIYQEFQLLQSKIVTLEKQASRANNLAMELENMKQSYEQLHKDLVRKQEKLEEVVEENQRMRSELDVLEDKLTESNLQRQQMNKKVQFLQDLNADMQSMSDTNKKLQTEIRRIGELESMLNMMSEERDLLLMRKRSDK
jgi:chromosome segregation ATPase